MKKIFLILLLYSCTKTEIIQQPDTRYAKIVGLNSDTTVNGIWDGGGKVLRINDHIIHGTGTLQNWIIDAAMTQQIFDTSLKLSGIKTYTNDGFSCAWYGANPSNTDNWWNIQKSINICLSNHIRSCFLPNGTYHVLNSGIEIASVVNNAYQQVSLHFYGDASYWDQGTGSTIQVDYDWSPAFNLQFNKGSEIDHIRVLGLYKVPNLPDSLWFAQTEAQFQDISWHHYPDWYTGISIDYHPPFDHVTRSGSTGINIHDVSIGNFDILLSFSQNAITLNDENITIDNLHLLDGKWGIANGQAQEKNNRITNIFSQGNLFCVLAMGRFGAFQSGSYTFDGANIAGRNIKLFDITCAHWYSPTITNWIAESIYSIGNISTQIPVSIENSEFNLNLLSKGKRIFTANSSQVVFNNDIIRYNDGLNSNVIWYGQATFTNCYYGGGNFLNQ